MLRSRICIPGSQAKYERALIEGLAQQLLVGRLAGWLKRHSFGDSDNNPGIEGVRRVSICMQ